MAAVNRTFMPFLGSNAPAKSPEFNLKVGNEIVKDQEKVAETLADYFASIADGIGGENVENLTETDFIDHQSVLKIAQLSIQNDAIRLNPLQKAQVQQVMESLKVKKASGCDSIPPFALKFGAEGIAISLTNLFNRCISEGKWPQSWKKGEWIPVFKRDDPLLKENYRPVTVLPAVDKVFEQIVARQLVGMFDHRLGQALSAYRKTHSCETTLIYLIEHWRLARDNKQLVGILSTDMSKAFDSMHPALLLSKLRAYGFEENLINLLRSYLCDRSNRVKLASQKSSWKQVNRGCPQGSALGPLLWNIFQNDLVYEIEQNLSMYADDHQLFEISDNVAMINNNLNASATKASLWYESNLLKGNLSKYHTMLINNKQRDSRDEISINVQGTDIESLDSIKLLGVTIDNKLNFSEHINITCKKANQRIGVLMRLKNLVPTVAKLHLFKAAILPYLTYCHLTWHFCRASDKRKLERTQERGLRAVFRDTKSKYEVLLKKANLKSLYERRLQDIACLMFKVKHDLCPPNVKNLFSLKSSTYNLRGADFHIPRFNTVTYGKHSLRYIGPVLWNRLSTNLKNLPSLQSFKRQITLINLSQKIEHECKSCVLCST